MGRKSVRVKCIYKAENTYFENDNCVLMVLFQKSIIIDKTLLRRYIAEILPIRRKTLSNQ